VLIIKSFEYFLIWKKVGARPITLTRARSPQRARDFVEMGVAVPELKQYVR
jgi:hypothetical protein